jgi:hypothetical protein
LHGYAAQRRVYDAVQHVVVVFGVRSATTELALLEFLRGAAGTFPQHVGSTHCPSSLTPAQDTVCF